MLALGLGVGATTAVFTLLDRVVLRPLPYRGAERLVMVWETNDTKGLPFSLSATSRKRWASTAQQRP